MVLVSSEAEFITIYGAIFLKRRLTGELGGHVAPLWISYLAVTVVFFLSLVYIYLTSAGNLLCLKVEVSSANSGLCA